MRAIEIPAGTVFGRLTVIEPARTAAGRRAMLCRCECGQTKAVTVSSLRAGYTKSCGYCGRKIRTTASRGEIPLYGKNACGRVALIDEENHELVSQYRWHVQEDAQPGRQPHGPYAATSWKVNGKVRFLLMHTLITGWPLVDHVDHDGLNNQRSNLREATVAQNAQNKRKTPGRWSSSYKGVFLNRRMWRACVRDGDKMRYLGYFPSEESAARAYDRAARELFGPFACTNFEDEPTQAMEAEWQAEIEAFNAERKRVYSAYKSEWWQQRQPVTRVCMVCGAEYQSKGNVSLYCGRACRRRGSSQQERERRQEGRLF